MFDTKLQNLIFFFLAIFLAHFKDILSILLIFFFFFSKLFLFRISNNMYIILLPNSFTTPAKSIMINLRSMSGLF